MKRHITIYFFLFFSSLSLTAQLPVKFDSHYKTIFARDLCRLNSMKQDIVLIDVRSPGEYSDTSQYSSLNMGRLKGAINIPIDSIQKNITVLAPYKNKTLVFYCSHSQRSRRVSYLLSKNDFADFYNLNGGMSHLNQMSTDEFPCKNELLLSNVLFKNVSTKDAIGLIKRNPGMLILDVRSATAFHSRDSSMQNNIGRIKNAINLPYAELQQRLQTLAFSKDQPILIYSQAGDGDAARTAHELSRDGFTNVYVLLAGIDDLLVNKDGITLIENPPVYKILNAVGALKLLKEEEVITIYDTRPKLEFENKVDSTQYYRNLGHLKNAVNLEESHFEKIPLPKSKKKPILVYGRGEAYKLAASLTSKGYSKVFLLRNLYDFVSSAFNVEGSKDALQYLVNHEGLY